MAKANLQTTQKYVSGPKIEKYRQMIRDGVKFDPIKVDGNIIVDGNHRCIDSQLERVSIDTIQWTKAHSAQVRD